MEVMLAVFILGIGVISVAAIFPAGISQQRRSNDDIMGPIVAENAIATLRSKLDQEDFGYFEMFVGPDQIPFDTTTGMIYGDWPWYRPGFVFSDDQNVSAIDIFSAQQARISAGYAQGGSGLQRASEFGSGGLSCVANNGGLSRLHGIPFNADRFTLDNDTDDPSQYIWQPEVLISQRERFYPMVPSVADAAAGNRVEPTYAWDCMFRRFQGRIYVAIVVYRVRYAGGEPLEYSVAPDPEAAEFPPLPYSRPLTGGSIWTPGGLDSQPGTIGDNIFIRGTDAGSPFDPTAREDQWQLPRQWILDQFGNVHRVVAGRRFQEDGPVALASGPTGMPALTVYNTMIDSDLLRPAVRNIWYLPREDSNNFILTPVYMTVKEL